MLLLLFFFICPVIITLFVFVLETNRVESISPCVLSR